MLDRLRAAVARFWPEIRLRWLLFGTLLFVAALPGISAIGLRVYENALVRRTEAEVLAQSATLAATAAVLWPDRHEVRTDAAVAPPGADGFRNLRYADGVESEIDLRSSPVLNERPAAVPSTLSPDAQAMAVVSQMQPVIERTKAATLASILLLDEHGILLNGRDRGMSYAHLPEIRAALAGQPVTVLRRKFTAFPSNGSALAPISGFIGLNR